MEKKSVRENKFSVWRILRPLLVSARDRDDVLEQLGMLFGSGVTILDSLDGIAEEMRSPAMRRIIEAIKKDVGAGTPLWRALDASGIFPEYAVTFIRIGEETGKLAENVALVSQSREKERMFHSKIRSAMMYPVFVLSLSLVVGVGIAWFILPKLATVFSELDVALPFITKALIATGGFLKVYGALAVPLFFLGFAVLGYIVFFAPRTRGIGERLLFLLPGVRRLIQETEIARLGHLFGALFDGGIPITRALHALSETASFTQYRAFYCYLRDSVDEGNSFQKSFELYRKTDRVLPPSIRRMIIAGERSGRIADTFRKIGEVYEAKMDVTAKNLTVILEPILLVIVWVGVVVLALGVILPIYGLVGGFNAERNVYEEPAVAEESMLPSDAGLRTEVSPLSTSSVLGGEGVRLLKILPTGLGYLNVRDTPSLSGALVARVTPGETYEYTAEENGWYKLRSAKGELGWVLGRYVELVEDE